MLTHEQNPEPGALGARYIVEGAWRSLRDQLLHLRIKQERVSLRNLRLCRLGSPFPEESNACGLRILLRVDAKVWSHDMRPTSLWLVAGYEDWMMVLASGSDAWEYRRVEYAHAIEKMREVLGGV